MRGGARRKDRERQVAQNEAFGGHPDIEHSHKLGRVGGGKGGNPGESGMDSRQTLSLKQSPSGPEKKGPHELMEKRWLSFML